jgi:hypothetical protein
MGRHHQTERRNELTSLPTCGLANLKAIYFNSLDRFWLKEQGISLMHIREFVFGNRELRGPRSGNLVR